jgi:hypothetical protein
MGFGISFAETFVGQLEATTEFPLQAVNLGVEAYGTDQALLMSKRHFKKFNTKAVVYTFIGAHITRNENYDRRLLFRGARFVGTKPLFDLSHDGTLFLKKKPLKCEDLNNLHLWEFIQLIWTRWGPKPTFKLTRALILEMKEYVESNGASFVVVHWDWVWGRKVPKHAPSPIFEGLNLNLIDTGINPPVGWSNWRIPEDSHPNARAHNYVSQLLVEYFKRQKLNLK